MVVNSKLYDILEVPITASIDEIKKAFKKLAIKYHPDKNNNPDANQKFQDINNAYQILSDPDKKQLYDNTGSTSDNQQINFNDFVNLFNQQFGNREPNIEIKMNVTIKEIFNGFNRSFKTSIKDKCCACNAIGGSQPIKCDLCQGSGMIHTHIQHGFFTITNSSPCVQCNKKGFKFTNICKDCNGKCVITRDKEFKVLFIKGNDFRKPFVFNNKGHFINDTTRTDVIVILNILNDSKFELLSNLNIQHKVFISLPESLIGFDKIITHLDNTKIRIKFDDIMEHKKKFVIKELGLSILGKHTDLLIEFIIEYPKKFNDDMKNKLINDFNYKKQNNDSVQPIKITPIL